MNRHYIATLQELREARSKLVVLEGQEIGVYEVEGEVHAWRSVCPHRGVSICKGWVGGTNLTSQVYEYHYDRDQQILRCPLHAWEFDLKTGQFLLDASVKLKRYETIIEEDRVYVVTSSKSGSGIPS
ncbi:Rieske (2Fe-2S) protein [Paenibacillus sp. FSL H8-0034]|uniref:Rieske (2Fe-2S) protein n=1 Tax=Paenibacillus sp. FSL H8-0034 TaxID=2954671 RepID=UPI0030F81565